MVRQATSSLLSLFISLAPSTAGSSRGEEAVLFICIVSISTSQDNPFPTHHFSMTRHKDKNREGSPDGARSSWWYGGYAPVRDERQEASPNLRTGLKRAHLTSQKRLPKFTEYPKYCLTVVLRLRSVARVLSSPHPVASPCVWGNPKHRGPLVKADGTSVTASDMVRCRDPAPDITNPPTLLPFNCTVYSERSQPVR